MRQNGNYKCSRNTPPVIHTQARETSWLAYCGISLFLQSTPAPANARDRESDSTRQCPDRKHLLAENQAPPSVKAFALRSLFLMSRHLPSFAWATHIGAEHPAAGREESRMKLRWFFMQPAHNEPQAVAESLTRVPGAIRSRHATAQCVITPATTVRKLLHLAISPH